MLRPSHFNGLNNFSAAAIIRVPGQLKIFPCWCCCWGRPTFVLIIARPLCIYWFFARSNAKKPIPWSCRKLPEVKTKTAAKLLKSSTTAAIPHLPMILTVYNVRNVPLIMFIWIYWKNSRLETLFYFQSPKFFYSSRKKSDSMTN